MEFNRFGLPARCFASGQPVADCQCRGFINKSIIELERTDRLHPSQELLSIGQLARPPAKPSDDIAPPMMTIRDQPLPSLCNHWQRVDGAKPLDIRPNGTCNARDGSPPDNP